MVQRLYSSSIRTLSAVWDRCRRGIVFQRDAPGRVVTVRVARAAPLLALGAALAAYAVWPVAGTAIVFAALLAALGLALALLRAQAFGLQGERRLTYAPLQVGDEIEEGIALHNGSFLPLVVALDDATTLPGYGLTSVQAVGGGETRTWRIHAICARRGIATLGPWSATLRDPFGVFEARVRFGHRQEIVVVPPLARADVQLAPRRARRGDRAALRQPLRADSAQASAVRAYVAGDPLRRIHWATSARRQALYVKQTDPESASDVWLVPDFCNRALSAAPPLAPGDASPVLEQLILLTVAAAQQLLERQLRVGLAYVTEAPVVVPARFGRAQLWPLLRALAPVQPTARDLDGALATLAGVIPARARVVVLSADVNADWPARAIASGRPGGIDLVLLDTAGDGRSAAEALQERGWMAQSVAADAVTPLLGAFGPLRRWEFRALGTGRVIAQQTPRLGHELERVGP